MITESIHEQFLLRTFELAELSVGKGNHPFGAVLVINNEIVLEAENTIAIDKDVTRHAEMNLMSEASKRFSQSELETAILYTSTEPCQMCEGAIYWAGVRNIVFSCTKESLNSIANNGLPKESINLVGPLLENLGEELHKKYWH